MKRKVDLTYFRKIYSQYKKGKSVAFLCRHYSISRTLFYRYQARLGSYKPHKLESDERLDLINKKLFQGHKVSHLAKQAGISRTLYYRWKKRYEAAGEGEKLYALNPKKAIRTSHPRRIGTEIEAEILSIIAAHPELSSHKIATLYGQDLKVGNHGVHSVLRRYSLNNYEKRLNYSLAHQPKPIKTSRARGNNPIWNISLRAFRLVLAPFSAIPKLPFNHPLLAALGAILLTVVLLYDLPAKERFGYFFAFSALLSGLIFFAYSLKYYLTLALIVGFSQTKRAEENVENSGKRGFLSKIFKLGDRSSLEPDLSGITLQRKPFVSIHIPLYNEPRVAERILLAVSNLAWPNYEVIVADDSTDKTTEIVKEFVKTNKRIKLSHRPSRAGYKGGALTEALRLTDPRAEFVLVFDADFIPFPDTIEQFIKHFAHLAAGDLEKVREGNIAAVQGYQWHVLNKSENWVTRGVRTEYAGNYIIERTGAQIYGGLKQIAGSVFCIRREVLEQLGWNHSITEDLSLTLRLYEAGYKIAYTPYIQTPSECVSTVQRLIRQRMRWAEGHSFNVARMFRKLVNSDKLTKGEKVEFFYLAPYYLQAAFFLFGTLGWFLSEIIFRVHLPFWTSLLGWSLVFSNFISLPLTNTAGLFLEESDERDYFGIGSFIVLSYILVPFQAYASVKGFLEKEEGRWFRTPKTGRITDTFSKGRIYNFLGKLLPWRQPSKKAAVTLSLPFGLSANQSFLGYNFKPKRVSFIARVALVSLLLITIFINYLAFFTPAVKAASSSTPAIEQQINIIDQTYLTASSTYAPTDNSLGMFKWDSTKYDGIANVYFEAVLKTDGTASAVASAALYNSSGSAVSGSDITNNTSTYTRSRSGDIKANLSDGTDYTVRLKYTTAAATVYIQAARLIVLQTNATKLTKSETSVEVGSNETAVNTSYATLGSQKIWCYSGNATCSAGSSSVYNPAPAAYFEATLKAPASVIKKLEQQIELVNDAFVNIAPSYNTLGTACVDTAKYDSGTYYFEVVAINNQPSGTQTVTFQKGLGDGGVTCGSGGGDTSTSITIPNSISTPTRYRTAAIGSFPTGEVSISSVSSGISISAARVIIDQSSASALTKTMGQIETFNDLVTTSTGGGWSSYYNNCGIKWYYDSNAYSPAPTAYFEAVLKAGASSTAYMHLYDLTAGSAVSGSEVSTTSTSLIRKRSSAITLITGHEYLAEFKTSDFTAGQFVNSKVILDQPSTINASEAYHKNINGIYFVTSSTYTSVNLNNYYDPATYSGTVVPYFEMASQAFGYSLSAQLYGSTSGAISGSSVSSTGENCAPADRTRSSAFTAPSAQELDTQVKSSGGDTLEYFLNSWTIIRVCSCMYAALYDTTSFAIVSGSEVSTKDSSSWSLVRSGAITLTTGHKYVVQVHASGTNAGSIANAKVILDQNSSSGISALETYQTQINTKLTTQVGTATQAFYIDKFDDSNFGGSGTYYFEATMSGNSKNSHIQTANLKLTDVDTPADIVTISNSSSTLSSIRSASITPTTNKQYDSYYWCTSNGTTCVADGASATVIFNNSWIIVQIASMPVPEVALILLPIAIFLPYVIRKLKMKSKNKDPIVTAEVRNAF